MAALGHLMFLDMIRQERPYMGRISDEKTMYMDEDHQFIGSRLSNRSVLLHQVQKLQLLITSSPNKCVMAGEETKKQIH